MSDQVWTDEQFDEMSWHDNCVHGLRIVEGTHGAGELILDLDYILEWIEAEESFQFRILPVTLKFREVTDLRILLDYATPTIALGPFSIHAIERKFEQRERYTAQVWKLLINSPVGEITFESQGFEQRGVGSPRLSSGQWLSPEVREHRA
jgi:hypothetical protein